MLTRKIGVEAADNSRVRANHSPESSGGGGASPVVQVTEPNQQPASPPAVVAAPAAAPPAAPPAARTVIEGEITEETIRLRTELDNERATRKKVESDHASITDEFHRYKDATEARATPVPIRKKAPDDKPFRLGRFL